MGDKRKMTVKSSFLLLFIVIIISACSSNNESAIQHQSKAEEKEVQIEEPIAERHETKEIEQEEVIDEEKEDITTPQYRMNPDNFDIEPLENAPDNIVLLTIDDAPDKHALEMARILKDLNVKAIFFVNGHFLDTDEEKNILKEIHEMGFSIGNHTMTHQNLKELSEQEQHKEIVELNNLVEEIIGERPKYLRAPFGANTDYSKKIALDEKMLVMNWTYGYDFNKEYMNKDAIADIMVNTNLLHDGANLLMHDRQWTEAALHDIVTGLQGKGYSIVDPHLIETP